MNRTWAWIIGLIVLAAVIVGIVVAAGGNSSNDNQSTNSGNTSTKPSTNSSSNTPPTQPSTTNKVTIANLAFSPSDITVKKGATVTWTNNDSTAHTVTSSAEHGPNSQNINPGNSYTFTFADEGTFNYHCSLHPQMTGTVTVTE
jgi:plastocyanin